MKTRKARIIYLHPEVPEARPFSTGWMGRSKIAALWKFLAEHGVTIARTELR
jgi:hypothetical protein